MEDLLITGARSGFGKYLHEQLGGCTLTRENEKDVIEQIKTEGVATIIHCAHTTNRNPESNKLGRYLEDTIFLTRRLLEIPHKNFIYMSSIDVYPNDGKEHLEDEIIDITQINSIYGISKLMSESLVREIGNNHLIIRPSGLLGKYTKKNNLLKLIEDKSPSLTLTSDSKINVVTYNNVLDFIISCRKREISGIFNICSTGNISMIEAAGIVKKEVQFGEHRYSPPNINNDRASSIVPALKSNSKEKIIDYLNT